ncbi:hypothetical protein TeGR_g11392 [Tetraparma gracilis]|uniref:VCBS repeat-containing protein n=1 Tax=Tetraparma gracilis TaxID=2962635 RepID=A0ABQ6MB24_9STRA|nr:hypothetical protein TeGR_g11392 [Tetraparma gracilis]
MKFSSTAILSTLSLASISSAAEYSLSWVKDISLPTPGFLEMIDDGIYMTSFNAEPFFLSKNGVYHLKAADFMTEEPTLLTDELDWPNDMTLLPEEMFGYRALAVGHGFLVPFGGHTTGGVSVINLDDPSSSPVKVTKDIKDWFYHKAYYRDMDGDGDLDLITARCRDNLQNRTIDDELGNAFAAEFMDVNNDGSMDILATNHLTENGGVFAYSWDNSEPLATAKITKHTLASGIDNVQDKGMAPGHSFTVFPNANDKTGKPYIMVDGDGAENYMMLSPKEEGEFEYDLQVLFPTNCTVGKSVGADVDGDGMSEVFIPLYEKNVVRVMRFVKEGEEVVAPPDVPNVKGLERPNAEKAAQQAMM